MIDAAQATAEQFEPLLDKGFAVEMEDAEMTLRLTECNRMTTSSREGGAFSLIFCGPEDLVLNQGIYRLKCDDTEIVTFLVPIGAAEGGMAYEAVYN